MRDVVFTATVALTVALLGPFGSYDAPVEARIVRSFAYGALSLVLLWPPMRLALRLGERAGVPELFTVVTGLVVLAAPVTLGAGFIAHLFDGDEPRSGLLQRYFGVLTMVVPIGAAYLLAERRLRGPSQGPEPVASEPRLLARLPVGVGREVIALQAEDHYARAIFVDEPAFDRHQPGLEQHE